MRAASSESCAAGGEVVAVARGDEVERPPLLLVGDARRGRQVRDRRRRRRGRACPGTRPAGSRCPTPGRRPSASRRGRAARRTPACSGSRCPGRRSPTPRGSAGPSGSSRCSSGTPTPGASRCRRGSRAARTGRPRTRPMCGNQSDTSMPAWPCFWNVRFEASSLFLSTPRRVLTGPNDAGSFWPCRRVSSGLGSKVSTCDGPPDMNRKMTRFAVGSKCGSFGASGSASRRAIRGSRGEQPLLGEHRGAGRWHAEPARRRCGGSRGGRGSTGRFSRHGPWHRSASGDSIQVHELVQVEQRPAQLAQRRLAQERRGPLPLRRPSARGRASAGTPARSAPSPSSPRFVSRVGQSPSRRPSPRRSSAAPAPAGRSCCARGGGSSGCCPAGRTPPGTGAAGSAGRTGRRCGGRAPPGRRLAGTGLATRRPARAASGSTTPGPPAFGFSRPLTTSSASRTASPSSRSRFIRDSSWLSGSFAAASGLDLRRLLVRLRQSASACASASAASRRRPTRVASQSSNSGCVGRSPRRPKSLGVATMPWPKWCCQSRFTITRAVSGLSGCATHFASASRRPVLLRTRFDLRRRRLAARRQHRGEAGCTSVALVRQLAALQQVRLRRRAGAVGQPHRHRQRGRLLARRTPSACFCSSVELRPVVGRQRLRDLGRRSPPPSAPSRRRVPAARRSASPAACGGRPAPRPRASPASPRTASSGAAPPARRSRRGSASSAPGTRGCRPRAPRLCSRRGDRQVAAERGRGEERLQAEVVGLRDRLELVVVAAGAARPSARGRRGRRCRSCR